MICELCKKYFNEENKPYKVIFKMKQSQIKKYKVCKECYNKEIKQHPLTP